MTQTTFSPNPNRRGDIEEIKVASWYLNNGYEVFRNIGCSGPVDIIVIKDGVVELLDVKTPTTYNYRSHIGSKLSKDQEKLGVKLVALHNDKVWTKEELEEEYPIAKAQPELPVEVDGIVYDKTSDAARHMGVTITEVRRQIHSNKYPNVNRPQKESE